MHEKHRANPKITRKGKEKRNKRKPSNRLITKEKRVKKRRERITSCESPNPRPIKLSSSKVRICFRSLGFNGSCQALGRFCCFIRATVPANSF